MASFTALKARTPDYKAPPVSPNATTLQKWKFRRNLVIYAAWKAGISQRVIADVFDLPRSRIASIVKQFQGYDPEHQ